MTRNGMVLRWCLSMAILGYWATLAQAHFVWIESQPNLDQYLVRSGFGEPEGWDPDLVDRMGQTEFWLRASDGQIRPLNVPLDAQEKEHRANVPAGGANAILAACDFGVTQFGAKPASWLRYTAKNLLGPPSAWNDTLPCAKLRIEVLATLEGNRVRLQVMHLGKPAPGAIIKATPPRGGRVEITTNEHGVAYWNVGETGVYALYVGIVAEQPGELQGKAYELMKDYATLTFRLTQSDAPAPTAEALPSLPEAITSFGAAVSDGWLYAYSGHIGGSHEHSVDNLSKAFRRINLHNPAAWQELPPGAPLQGLGLVAHHGTIVRVGGMAARNRRGDDEDMVSTDEVARFDPQTSQWSALPPLPDARSSHDAVVVGDHVYVAGGWKMQGKGQENVWHDTAWRLDLATPGAQWEALPLPQFKRRALSLAAAGGKVYVVAGLTPEGTLSTQVDLYDPVARKWSPGPALPEGPMHGFGPAAVGVGEQLYVSLASGLVFRLEGDHWTECGKLQTPRLLHRLVMAGPDRLLAVAGSSRGGHLATIEELRLAK